MPAQNEIRRFSTGITNFPTSAAVVRAHRELNGAAMLALKLMSVYVVVAALIYMYVSPRT
jgi:hypothetical protein